MRAWAPRGPGGSDDGVVNAARNRRAAELRVPRRSATSSVMPLVCGDETFLGAEDRGRRTLELRDPTTVAVAAHSTAPRRAMNCSRRLRVPYPAQRRGVRWRRAAGGALLTRSSGAGATGSSACPVEADIEGWGGVGNPADSDVGHPGIGHGPQGSWPQPARCLKRCPPRGEPDSGAKVS